MQGVWVFEIKELKARGEEVGLEKRGRWDTEGGDDDSESNVFLS